MFTNMQRINAYFTEASHSPYYAESIGILDLRDLRQPLSDDYSHTGRPSIDPELMIRMRVIGYCLGIRPERRLSDLFDPVRLEPAAQPLPDISLELRLPTGAHVGPVAGRIPGPQQDFTFYDLHYSLLISHLTDQLRERQRWLKRQVRGLLQEAVLTFLRKEISVPSNASV